MANNWAIVVGINEYKRLPNAPLKFAVADALAMRSFLCERADFERKKVLLCADGRDGTVEADLTTLRDILRHQIPQGVDNLWFFFSGHGIADHLMPSNGNPRDLEGTTISIHFVTDCLRKCKAKNIVLVLDMCRNENYDAAQKNVETIEASLRSLVKEREGQQGIVTLFSCSRGESSYEIADLEQGAFTYALLEGLRLKTIVRDLESHLVRRVTELHEKSGKFRKQSPLVIPEPGWKYDQSIFSPYVAEMNVAQFKEMAIDAESDGDLDRALQLWKKINLVATNADDKRRSLNKINDLVNRLNPVIKPVTPNTSEVPLEKVDLGRSNPRSQPDDSPIRSVPRDPIPQAPLKRVDRSLGLESFEFVTCKVNKQGKIADRTTKTAQYFRQNLGKGVSIDMVLIPDGKLHNIQIPEFFMSKTSITQAQWEAVSKLQQVKIKLKSNPSRFKGSKRPVEKVSWWMAEEFCKRLSIATQQNYHLPSEVQWEYTCMAGTTTQYYFGNMLSSKVANYGNSIKETTEVEKYPANAWGLYDMHGNVWEWCADHHSSDFKIVLKDSNSTLSRNLGFDRILWGGSWIADPRRCASDFRYYHSPAIGHFYDSGSIGFRVACSSPRT